MLLVVPAYNCAPQISRVLRELTSCNKLENLKIIIIDNRSSDNTLETAKEVIAQEGLTNAYAFRTVQNNSLGGTHKIAFNYAIEQGFDYVAIFHGDGQGSTSELTNLMEFVLRENPEYCVLGSRFSLKSNLVGYSRIRIFGNILLNSVYSILSKRRLSDLGSGLNIYPTKELKNVNYMYFYDSLTFNYELILQLVKLKIPFKFKPITWEESDQISNARNLVIFRSGIEIAFRYLFKVKPKFSYENKRYELEYE